MARHKHVYDGEHFTVKRSLKLTPGLSAELDAAAARSGATWSDFVRELLSRRMGVPAAVAGARRDPDTIALVRALDRAALQASALGNNLNQITRRMHQLDMSAPAQLEPTLDALRQTLAFSISPGSQLRCYQQPDQGIWTQRYSLRLGFSATGIGAPHVGDHRLYVWNPGASGGTHRRDCARSHGQYPFSRPVVA